MKNIILLFLLLSFSPLLTTYAEIPAGSLPELENKFQQAMSLQQINPEQSKVLFTEAGYGYLTYLNTYSLSVPEIYYNAGNAYFMSEDYGMAIYCYLKGLEKNPSNKDLLYNLNAVRLERKNQFLIKDTITPIKIILFWHYYFNSAGKMFFAFIFLIVTFLLLILWMKRKKSYLLFFASSCFVLMLIFSISLFHSLKKNESKQIGVVTADQFILKKGDNISYEAVLDKPIHNGTEFEFIEERNGWIHISIHGAGDGWTKTDNVIFINE